jgi:vitamin B12 transporter
MFLFSHVLGAVLALSPSASPSPSPSPVPEIAHVYTADRSDETLKNSTRTTYVVTHDDIVRYGYRTVAGALEDVPGMQISPFGAIGASVDYGIRGSSSAQVLVLVDGLPAPGSSSNSVELGNLPTTGVDHIEVVEGGGSTLYGAGAIGGIINIITQRTAQYDGTVRYGSFADRELDLSTPHVQFSRILSNNDFPLPDGTIRPDSDYEASALHVNEDARLGSFDLAVRAGVESDHLGAPGPNGQYLSPSSRETDLNEDANLTLSRKAAQSLTTMQFGGTNQHITFDCDANTDPNCYYAYQALNTEGRVDFNLRNLVSGSKEQLLYGVDLSRGVVRADTGGSAAPGTPPISIDALAQTAAYAQERISGGWGSFYAGVRGERDGSLGGAISPSAGATIRLSNEAAIKANFANAFRAPNASELYFPGYGVPTLRPERAQVGDLSLVDSRLLGGASVGWFTNRTNDLIEYNPATFTLAQVDHAFIQGLTFDVKTRVFNGFTTSFNLTDLYRAQDVDTQARLPNDPVITANLRLDFTASPVSMLDSFGVLMHMAGARGFVDPTLPLYDQPVAFTSVDAYVRVRAGRALLLSVRGYNLGNERYAAVAGYPMPGRSVLFEVSTR